jgi:hypothetical protein
MFASHVFASPLTDLAFKAWLAFFLLVNTIQIVIWAQRRHARVRVPAMLTRSSEQEPGGSNRQT